MTATTAAGWTEKGMWEKKKTKKRRKNKNWATKAMVVQVLKKNRKGTGRGEQVEK